MSNNPHDLFAALIGAPALPGAKCRGRSHLFDEADPDEHPDDRAYRQSHALRLCQSCPALAGCQTWFDDLTPSKRPPGVIAGRVHTRKQYRPRNTTTEGETA